VTGIVVPSAFARNIECYPLRLSWFVRRVNLMYLNSVCSSGNTGVKNAR